jgi:uncharacterized protein (DUF39 family)
LREFAAVSALSFSWIAPVSTVKAVELNGSWATAASACGQVFIKKDRAISFRQDSDQYGGGFILEGDRIRGQMQTCTITRRKEDGNVVHMVAKCADDIMTSNNRRQHDCTNFPGNAGVHLELFALSNVIRS